jgi:uncharacterized membrane protein HdeD (DUF308 family)
MLKSLSTSLIVRGVLAVIVGIIAIAWPGVTVYALVVLFAIYAFMDAGLQTMRAFSSGSAGPVIGHLVVALLDLAAGVVALVWPDITVLALAILIAIWAFMLGFLELWLAFRKGESAGTRALFILGGLVAIAFGVVLSSRPDEGVLTLALLFGLFSFAYGVTQIVVGVEARRDLHALQTATS